MPVTLDLAETVADALIAKLQAGMSARVAAINAARNDGIVVAAPDASAYYVGGLPGIPPPAACIVVTELGAEDFEAEGPHSFVAPIQMLVWIQEVDTDRSTLARKLWRQAQAVTETVWDDDPKEALSGSAFHVRPLRRVPGPVFSPEDGRSMWTGHMGVVFLCRTFEG